MTMTPLTPLEREYYAKEAQRLVSDDVLKLGLAKVRERALEALIRADANKITDVVRLQAKVAVCDEFMDELRSMIEAHSVSTGPRMV